MNIEDIKNFSYIKCVNSQKLYPTAWSIAGQLGIRIKGLETPHGKLVESLLNIDTERANREKLYIDDLMVGFVQVFDNLDDIVNMHKWLYDIRETDNGYGRCILDGKLYKYSIPVDTEEREERIQEIIKLFKSEHYTKDDVLYWSQHDVYWADRDRLRLRRTV